MAAVIAFDELAEVFERLQIPIRFEPIDGESGGLCRIRGQSVLFVDTLADEPTRMERCLEALARLPEADDVFIHPGIRERIETIRSSKKSALGS